MRPLEALLSIVNLLAFVALAAPLPPAAAWLRLVAPLALLFAGAQLLHEGSRAQMLPAYVLAGLFALVWLLQKAATGNNLGPLRWSRWLLAGLGGLALAFSVVLPVIVPVFRFPAPSGPYQIGTVTYHWVDGGRAEIYTANPDDRRELMVQIWYPAQADPTSPRAPYIQDAQALAAALARVRHLPSFLLGNLKYVTTNAFPSAPVAGSGQRFPVLLFLEGTTGFRQMNTFQVEELVSHGYIVVGIDQPYFAAVEVVFPDGRRAAMEQYEAIRPLIRQSYLPAEHAPEWNGQTFEEGIINYLAQEEGIINYLAQDVLFTLAQLATLDQADPGGILTGRLDLERVGIFGVSGGGIVAAEACRLEPQLQACLMMDAPMPLSVVRAGLQQPGMWITRDEEIMRLERERAGGWPEDEIQAHVATMRAVYNSLPANGYFVEVPGIFHINFTDVPYWSPLLSWMGLTGPIDAQRAFTIINAYSLAFFDRYIQSRPVTLLDGPAEVYPEVSLETRRP